MPTALLTVDLGFGDAGKGSLVDFLTRDRVAHTVVRYNGGAQAGHRVVTAEERPREHVFAQFGSGTLAGAATYLSRFMLLDPPAMVEEARHLEALGVADPFGRVAIDAGALVITPFQRAVNRLRELARGDGRHGSCGMGIGETMFDSLAHGERALFVGDLRHPDRLRAKLRFLQAVNVAKLADFAAALPDLPQTAEERDLLMRSDWEEWLMETYRAFAQTAQIVTGDYLRAVLRRPGTVIFEGAQGVLLDEWRGFHPHTTWSTTTLANADTLLREAGYVGRVERIGLTRAYATRHGDGPFVTEVAEMAAALPDARNRFGDWQRGFRVGWLDLVLLRYALAVTGRLDYLAVTCLDRLAELTDVQICTSYRLGPLEVQRILPSPDPQDLAYQAQITDWLGQARPILEPVADPADLLRRMEQALGVPVGLTSHGPTAADKRRTAAYRPRRLRQTGRFALPARDAAQHDVVGVID